MCLVHECYRQADAVPTDVHNKSILNQMKSFDADTGHKTEVITDRQTETKVAQLSIKKRHKMYDDELSETTATLVIKKL